MSSYLLGTQCLFDLGRNDGGALQQWFEGQAPQRGLFVEDIALSAFSVSIIARHFALKPPANEMPIAAAPNCCSMERRDAPRRYLPFAMSFALPWFSRRPARAGPRDSDRRTSR